MIPPMSPEPERQEFSPCATLAESGGKVTGPSPKPVATLTKAHLSRHYEPSLALGASLAKPSEFHLVLSLVSEEPMAGYFPLRASYTRTAIPALLPLRIAGECNCSSEEAWAH